MLSLAHAHSRQATVAIARPARIIPFRAPRRLALPTLRGIEDLALEWSARHAITMLRVSLGIVFFWFGVLKFFPGLSPAQDLAARTMGVLTFGMMKPALSLPMLATWECLIGLGLICGACLRATLLLLFLQMLGTLTPLAFFPHEAFTRLFYAPSMEGQYIIKNIVLISAGVVIASAMRGESRTTPAAAR